jgi:hypothetical protein
MKSKKHIFSGIVLIIFLISSMTIRVHAETECAMEGGYAGNDATAPTVVYNFLRHFDYEQFYWACGHQFTSQNNNYVDAMDFAYYCGHGAPMAIAYYSNCSGSGSSTYLDLSAIGSSSDGGLGDNNLEFIVFHAPIFPSSAEPTTLHENWSGIFDGLHLALGFTTTGSSVYRSSEIADYYGEKMAAGGNYVLWSWFDAINAVGSGYGCAIGYPGAENDIYQGTIILDPPADHTEFCIWYQY